MADAILQSLAASTLFDLRGVVAVVTGGGTGIGMMISSTLVANGATVYIIGPVQTELDTVCASYNAAAENVPTRGKMFGLKGDIRFKTEAARLAAEMAKHESHITVLFNNAGIHTGPFARPPPGSTARDYVAACFDGVSQDDFDRTLQTNAVGPYWLAFAFLPLLEAWKSADGYGKFVPQIVMTSSISGWTKDPMTAGLNFPYMFSKSAIGHATAALAHELLPLGIRVNGIAPGLFATRLTTAAADENGMSVLPSGVDWGFEIPTEAGAGSPKDMGTLVLFLVANWFVNGETVLIDGGTLLKHPSAY